MTIPSLSLLLSFCFIFCLIWLWHLDWVHQGLPHLTVKTAHPLVHRPLKPRTPLDCPVCRLVSPAPSAVERASAPVRPWREMKSRRRAPKRVNTAGFACPNQQCPYCGITAASIHALVGDGKHGQAERIQTFRCQACRTTFTARRDTPLYRLKTPSQQVAMVLTALAEGLDPSAAERIFGYRQTTITTWLSRAGEHAQSLHEHYFHALQIPHLQLDELRTRLRCANKILWLWLTIDPLTKLLPVLELGPHRSLQPVARVEPWRTPHMPMAGGARSDLLSGEEMLPTAQAGAGLAGDASWHSGRSQSRLAAVRLLWSVEHRFHRAGKSDRPTWGDCSRSPHLGHSSVVSSPARPSAGVASLLSLCAPPCFTPNDARPLTSARWQPPGATLPTAHSSDGSRQNHPTMDDVRGTRLPFAKAFGLRGIEAKCGCSAMPQRGG
jgi:transposase-like protein